MQSLPRRHCHPGNRIKEEPSPDKQGEGHGRHQDLGRAVPTNLPAQRARNVDRVDQGTGEALPGPVAVEPYRKWSPYKPDAKSALRPKGVRGGHSTEDGRA